MELVSLTSDLHFLRFPVGHVYVWRDPDGLTVIDSGAAGSAPFVAEAIGALGCRTSDVRRLVLTHSHVDHVGGAAEIAGWGDVTVLAHRADAPVIRGDAEEAAPVLADWERPIFEQANAQIAPGRPAPVNVDREVEDGDVVDFGGGARVVSVPGHTEGSIALYLPGPRVLFTGDLVARDPQSRDPRAPVMLGVFNTDTARAAASFRRLAELDVEVACFGHGEPVTADAAGFLRATAEKLPS